MKPPLKRTLRHPGGAIKLFSAKPAKSYRENFGDIITPLIIKSKFGLQCTWEPPNKCSLAGAGSIIEMLHAAKGRNRPIVWGSGFIAEGDNTVTIDEFDIRAVRGIESLKRIEGGYNCGIQLGDPGLLADCLLKTTPKKFYTLGVVPHICDGDTAAVSRLKKEPGVKLIDITDDPVQVITDIASSHFILSSSLHGLIAADAVGTPNAHLKLSTRVIGGSYKFRDYYSAFSDPPRYRPMTPEVVLEGDLRSITEKISEHFIPPSDIDRLRQGLMDSFPYK